MMKMMLLLLMVMMMMMILRSIPNGRSVFHTLWKVCVSYPLEALCFIPRFKGLVFHTSFSGLRHIYIYGCMASDVYFKHSNLILEHSLPWLGKNLERSLP